MEYVATSQFYCIVSGGCAVLSASGACHTGDGVCLKGPVACDFHCTLPLKAKCVTRCYLRCCTSLCVHSRSLDAFIDLDDLVCIEFCFLLVAVDGA